MSLQLSNLFGVKDKPIAAIAEGFSTNGAKVYITGRRVEVLEKAAEELRGRAAPGGQVIPLVVLPIRVILRLTSHHYRIKGDVSTKDGCGQLVEQIKQREDHV
ncbi:hypothetical protein AnigIFM63309_007700 [Aspergillus niger]|nr:hypothetical protein AnigIFM63309_007700 [Aspergillus niger]